MEYIKIKKIIFNLLTKQYWIQYICCIFKADCNSVKLQNKSNDESEA